MTERERVEQNLAGEPSLPVELRVVGRCADPHGSLERIRQVMTVVADRREESDPWPTDSWWQEHLPPWFTSAFRPFEVPSRHENDWDFGSWLDTIKCPGWEWWSSRAEPDRFVVKLWADSWPYAIGVFEYLARAAGADVVEITEEG